MPILLLDCSVGSDWVKNNENDHFIYSFLFTKEARLTREGLYNYHNVYVMVEESPKQSRHF